MRVLVLVASTGGLTRTEFLLDNHVFQVTEIICDYYEQTTLPAHDVVFNAIGDAEASADALTAAARILTLTAAPVINRPDAVKGTGLCEGNARRLAHVPGLVTPITALIPREMLAAEEAATTLAAHGLAFPLLMRSPGYHTGQYFSRIDEPTALGPAVAGLPGKALLAMQFLDSSGKDGKARKYRVMTIDGQLYPLHLAIASDWKVHYFSAEMATNADNRAEELAFSFSRTWRR